ncbi:NADPH:quinone reductase [Ornithinimicrobium avium]|uniref:NADPH:quinone reductase n=2 Tax=Ornithinimicrobium avium TaxID=2283195 RepID=A0A345NPL0_9MICO|nr:NADPH:quinone reductase [Ornithinimicrobium avium]
MVAAYVEELGPAELIRVGPLPVPVVGPTEVLVRVEVVAVDPVDTLVRWGAFPTPVPLPFVVGRDLVGTVAAVGAGVARFGVGDRVWSNSLGHGGRQGSFAEYAVVPPERLYHLPRGVDPVQMVALAHPAATAWLGLHRHARAQAGETILVGGGGGNVGECVVRLAVAAGLRVLATASAADLERVGDAGAEVVVDYRAADVTAQLRAAAPEGIDVHWDTSGHHDLEAAVALARRGARILLTAAGPEASVPLPVGAAYTKDVDLLGFVISNATVPDLAAAARAVGGRLSDGTLRARVTEELPLSATAEAHRRVEAGRVRGRLVLRP